MQCIIGARQNHGSYHCRRMLADSAIPDFIVQIARNTGMHHALLVLQPTQHAVLHCSVRSRSPRCVRKQDISTAAWLIAEKQTQLYRTEQPDRQLLAPCNPNKPTKQHLVCCLLSLSGENLFVFSPPASCCERVFTML